MDIQNELTLSYYKELSSLSKNKSIYLVQHIESGKLFVKKILDVYSIDIYTQLKNASINGVPQIYECFEDDEKLYIIEEYIHGKTLEEELVENGTLSEERCISLLEQLCPIMESLHTLNPPIIHRDIKPSNIIITSDDTLKLVDFNAAKNYSYGSSKDTTLLGTHNFAAPEQYGFSQSDVRTDIYGIGVTINYLLTAQYPNECIYEGSLGAILSKCLKLNPEERYSSCNELLADIDSIKNTKKSYIAKLPKYILIVLIILALCLFAFAYMKFRNLPANAPSVNDTEAESVDFSEQLKSIDTSTITTPEEETDSADGDSIPVPSAESHEAISDSTSSDSTPADVSSDTPNTDDTKSSSTQKADSHSTSTKPANTTDSGSSGSNKKKQSTPSVEAPTPTPTPVPGLAGAGADISEPAASTNTAAPDSNTTGNTGSEDVAEGNDDNPLINDDVRRAQELIDDIQNGYYDDWYYYDDGDWYYYDEWY